MKRVLNIKEFICRIIKAKPRSSQGLWPLWRKSAAEPLRRKPASGSLRNPQRRKQQCLAPSSGSYWQRCERSTPTTRWRLASVMFATVTTSGQRVSKEVIRHRMDIEAALRSICHWVLYGSNQLAREFHWFNPQRVAFQKMCQQKWHTIFRTSVLMSVDSHYFRMRPSYPYTPKKSKINRIQH